MKRLLVFMVLLGLCVVVKGCQDSNNPTSSEQGFFVTHSPNPCNVHSSSAFPEDPYPYMWYYRTEVKNTLSVPLQITWFAAYVLVDGAWKLGRELDTDKFVKWYTEGDPVPDGVIQPGQTAVCDPNWTGSQDQTALPVKWAYRAVAPDGQEYYAEAVIEHTPITE